MSTVLVRKSTYTGNIYTDNAYIGNRYTDNTYTDNTYTGNTYTDNTCMGNRNSTVPKLTACTTRLSTCRHGTTLTT